METATIFNDLLDVYKSLRKRKYKLVIKEATEGMSPEDIQGKLARSVVDIDANLDQEVKDQLIQNLDFYQQFTYTGGPETGTTYYKAPSQAGGGYSIEIYVDQYGNINPPSEEAGGSPEGEEPMMGDMGAMAASYGPEELEELQAQQDELAARQEIRARWNKNPKEFLLYREINPDLADSVMDASQDPLPSGLTAEEENIAVEDFLASEWGDNYKLVPGKMGDFPYQMQYLRDFGTFHRPPGVMRGIEALGETFLEEFPTLANNIDPIFENIQSKTLGTFFMKEIKRRNKVSEKKGGRGKMTELEIVDAAKKEYARMVGSIVFNAVRPGLYSNNMQAVRNKKEIASIIRSFNEFFIVFESTAGTIPTPDDDILGSVLFTSTEKEDNVTGYLFDAGKFITKKEKKISRTKTGKKVSQVIDADAGVDQFGLDKNYYQDNIWTRNEYLSHLMLRVDEDDEDALNLFAKMGVSDPHAWVNQHKESPYKENRNPTNKIGINYEDPKTGETATVYINPSLMKMDSPGLRSVFDYMSSYAKAVSDKASDKITKKLQKKIERAKTQSLDPHIFTAKKENFSNDLGKFMEKLHLLIMNFTLGSVSLEMTNNHLLKYKEDVKGLVAAYETASLIKEAMEDEYSGDLITFCDALYQERITDLKLEDQRLRIANEYLKDEPVNELSVNKAIEGNADAMLEDVVWKFLSNSVKNIAASVGFMSSRLGLNISNPIDSSSNIGLFSVGDIVADLENNSDIELFISQLGIDPASEEANKIRSSKLVSISIKSKSRAGNDNTKFKTIGFSDQLNLLVKASSNKGAGSVGLDSDGVEKFKRVTAICAALSKMSQVMTKSSFTKHNRGSLIEGVAKQVGMPAEQVEEILSKVDDASNARFFKQAIMRKDNNFETFVRGMFSDKNLVESLLLHKGTISLGQMSFVDFRGQTKNIIYSLDDIAGELWSGLQDGSVFIAKDARNKTGTRFNIRRAPEKGTDEYKEIKDASYQEAERKRQIDKIIEEKGPMSDEKLEEELEAQKLETENKRRKAAQRRAASEAARKELLAQAVDPGRSRVGYSARKAKSLRREITHPRGLGWAEVELTSREVSKEPDPSTNLVSVIGNGINGNDPLYRESLAEIINIETPENYKELFEAILPPDISWIEGWSPKTGFNNPNALVILDSRGLEDGGIEKVIKRLKDPIKIRADKNVLGSVHITKDGEVKLDLRRSYIREHSFSVDKELREPEGLGKGMGSLQLPIRYFPFQTEEDVDDSIGEVFGYLAPIPVRKPEWTEKEYREHQAKSYEKWDKSRRRQKAKRMRMVENAERVASFHGKVKSGLNPDQIEQMNNQAYTPQKDFGSIMDEIPDDMLINQLRRDYKLSKVDRERFERDIEFYREYIKNKFEAGISLDHLESSDDEDLEKISSVKGFHRLKAGYSVEYDISKIMEMKEHSHPAVMTSDGQVYFSHEAEDHNKVMDGIILADLNQYLVGETEEVDKNAIKVKGFVEPLTDTFYTFSSSKSEDIEKLSTLADIDNNVWEGEEPSYEDRVDYMPQGLQKDNEDLWNEDPSDQRFDLKDEVESLINIIKHEWADKEVQEIHLVRSDLEAEPRLFVSGSFLPQEQIEFDRKYTAEILGYNVTLQTPEGEAPPSESTRIFP